MVAAAVGYEEGDVRTEAALAKAGVTIDPAVVAKGEAQLGKEAAEQKAGK